MTELKRQIRYLPVFVALICVYFYDVLFKGVLLAVEDGVQYYYPMMITMSKQYENFIFPFWNPLQYSGFPLLAAIEPGALYPPNIVLPLLFEPSAAYNLNIMLHYVLAGFFTFLYARQIGLRVFASVAAGTVFSLLGYMPAHINHQSVIASGVWVPLLLFFYERMKQNLRVKDALYAALAIALQVFAGHPQIAFYTYILLLLYAVFSVLHLDPAKRLRFVLLCVLSVVSGLLLALPQLAATYELTTLGARTKTTYEFFSSYPFPAHMLPTFLFPFFYHLGGRPSGEMWGPVPAMGQEAFAGTLTFLLSLVVVVKWRKHPLILFWAAIAVLALVLALGDFFPPLNRLLYHLPGYNAFRGHSKHMLEVSFALSILCGFGLSFMQDEEKGKRFLVLPAGVLLAVTAMCFIVFTFLHGTLQTFFADTFSHMQHFQLRWARAGIPETALSISDASIYLPLVIMSAYLICISGLIKAKKTAVRAVLFCGIFSLILAEAFIWKPADLPQAGEVENFNKELYSFLGSRTDGRTAFLTNAINPLTAMPYGVRLSEGYESLETGAYAKLLPRMYLQPPRVWRALLLNNSLLSMLNTRYLVVSGVVDDVDKIRMPVVEDPEGRWLPVSPSIGGPEAAGARPLYRRMATFASGSLYENLLALPRAYPVIRLRAVESPDELRSRLFAFQLLPWYEAAVSAEDLKDIGTENFSPGYVSLVEEKPDKVTLTTKFGGKGFVVLADQFYPGWEAYIDGKRSRIYKANSVLRGVVAPEGEHTIVFCYVPRHIYASMAVSGIFLAAILFFLVKKKSPAETNSEAL